MLLKINRLIEQELTFYVNYKHQNELKILLLFINIKYNIHTYTRIDRLLYYYIRIP